MSTLSAVALAASLGTAFATIVVAFLRRPLHVLLIELCGNDARARFWSIYWSAALVLGALFGMLAASPSVRDWPDDSAAPLVLEGFRGSLLAVLVVLGGMGIVLLRSIAAFESARSSHSRSSGGAP